MSSEQWDLEQLIEDVGELKKALRVQLSGHDMELYGKTVANRPAADSVPIGAVFMAVDTGDMWQSNGTDWVGW